MSRIQLDFISQIEIHCTLEMNIHKTCNITIYIQVSSNLLKETIIYTHISKVNIFRNDFVINVHNYILKVNLETITIIY